MADEQPKPEPDKWLPRLKVAGLVLAWCGWLVAVALALREGKPVPAPPPVWEPQPVGAMGWVNDPQAVQAVSAALQIKVFADTPAFAAGGEPDHVYLWDAARKVTGNTLPARNQGQVGSCVSFGAAAAVEHLLCVQIANGRPEEFKALAQEIIYGGSRVEIGGGRIRGDGSVGAWAADWCSRYGVVARGVHQVGGSTFDLTSYDEARCREYGRRGVPDQLEPLAKQRPVKAITQVRTAAECRKALASGYPVTVASDQGFVMRRDADGVCKPSGTWAHQMAILGYRPGHFWIQNSWGADAHTGPTGPGNPPDGGFWADERTVGRMLAQGDSWAFGDVVGFPARDLLNWEVRRGVFPAKQYAHRRIEVAPWESLSSPAW